MTEPRRGRAGSSRLEHTIDSDEHHAARERRAERRYHLRAAGTFEEAITCWPREELRRYFGRVEEPST